MHDNIFGSRKRAVLRTFRVPWMQTIRVQWEELFAAPVQLIQAVEVQN
jgi:hypothetical protein